MGMGVHAAGTAAGWGQGLPGGPQLPPHHATTVTAPPGVQAAPPPPPPPAQMMAYPMQQFQVTIIFLSLSLSLFFLSVHTSSPLSLSLIYSYITSAKVWNRKYNTGISKEELLKVKFGKFDSWVEGKEKIFGEGKKDRKLLTSNVSYET